MTEHRSNSPETGATPASNRSNQFVGGPLNGRVEERVHEVDGDLCLLGPGPDSPVDLGRYKLSYADNQMSGEWGDSQGEDGGEPFSRTWIYKWEPNGHYD